MYLITLRPYSSLQNSVIRTIGILWRLASHWRPLFIWRDSVTRFLLRFFSLITFPQASENNIRVISSFENSHVKVHHRYQWHRRQICHQFRLCCWHRWQIMGTISGCRHLKVNLKAKIPEAKEKGFCSNLVSWFFSFLSFYLLSVVALVLVLLSGYICRWQLFVVGCLLPMTAEGCWESMSVVVDGSWLSDVGCWLSVSTVAQFFQLSVPSLGSRRMLVS